MLRYGLRRIDSSAPLDVERLPSDRMELLMIQHEPRRRPQEVRQPVATPRLERVRPRNLHLMEGFAPGLGCEVEAVARHDPAVVEGVFERLMERDEPRLSLEFGCVEPERDVDRRPGEARAPRAGRPAWIQVASAEALWTSRRHGR